MLLLSHYSLVVLGISLRSIPTSEAQARKIMTFMASLYIVGSGYKQKRVECSESPKRLWVNALEGRSVDALCFKPWKPIHLGSSRW